MTHTSDGRFLFKIEIFKMAISREKKQELVTQYVQDLKEAKNLVVFKQSGLSVATDADIRREVRETE